jgi:hypothetical protein
LVGVGSAGVEVGPAVGIKLGRVGVRVAAAGAGGMGVGVGGKISGIGLINNKAIIAIKTTRTNPAKTPMVRAWARVTLSLLPDVHFTLKCGKRKAQTGCVQNQN